MSLRFVHVLPRSAEVNTTVRSRVLPGPKKSCAATYSPPGNTAIEGEPIYCRDVAGL
jgi:hypothetical protein